TIIKAENSATQTTIAIGNHGFHCSQSGETRSWFALRDGKPPNGKLKPTPAKCPDKNAANPITNHFFKSNGWKRIFFVSSNPSPNGLRIGSCRCFHSRNDWSVLGEIEQALTAHPMFLCRVNYEARDFSPLPDRR